MMGLTRILVMCVLRPWTWRYDLGSMVMSCFWVMDNKCVKYYQDQTWQYGVMARIQILGMFDLDLGDMTLGEGHDTSLGQGQQLCEISQIQHGSEELWPIQGFWFLCALGLWPWRYDLGSSSWHTLASWTPIVWNIIQIQYGSEELWPRNGFWLCVHCALDLGDMTLGQCHDTPFGHEQQFMNYCPDQTRV